MEIGKLLKYYRMLHNLTQSEVAELADINEKYLGRIERDESVPTIDKIEQLCHAFDIRLSDFLMVSPERILMRPIDNIESRPFVKEELYYCNCCGCSFNECEALINDGELCCPECGCRFDEEEGFIDRTTVYVTK